jgi:uncharacterized protein YyaL (SSP411 family)
LQTENRLAKEKSPYLLQHKYNPVDWYPWSDEAFQKAKQEDKPVFLSIGYSTCHWCHVMEYESFEDEEIARLMNDAFVSIKVDREERPDIDGIYMTVCQMLTGGGGWPLTIIMAPDKKPFFAGTYFPKDGRFGRIGMKELIPRIKELWQNKRNDILNSADHISSALQSAAALPAGNFLGEEIFKIAFKELESRFDNEHGGFGSSPKFPTPHNLIFLLRYWKRYGEKKALDMVEKTLLKMRRGGIYDHIGFGFSRYSTDPQWLVPHFEKMLYDQALLCMAYTETYLATKNPFYKKTVEEILEYVKRDMTFPEGGFYSAEDADSEGEEGKFYLWTENEIRNILSGAEADLFVKVFNVKKEGNWIDSVHGTKTDTNILHLKNDISALAEENSLSEKELIDKIEFSREKLFAAREKRIHPHKDDKILTDWNGLMISAFAKAAQAFNNKEYSETAKKAADFIIGNMITKDGKLMHRYRESEAGITANADDYAFFIQALLDLYETISEIKYLKLAVNLNEVFINHFWDKDAGGFFFTPDYGEKLIVRQKEIYDGAIPSGNSVAMLNLLKIGRITANTEFDKMADSINKAFSNQVSKHPSAFTQFLVSLDFAIGPSREIIFAGKFNPEDQMLKSINEIYFPNRVLLFKDSDEALSITPYLQSYQALEEKTIVYVCENYTCKLPAYNPDDLKNLF